MATSFMSEVHCAKFTDKVKSKFKKVKSKFSNKYAMSSKDARTLTKAVSTMSELGSTIRGMKKFVKLVKNMPKQAGKQDASFKDKIKEATATVTDDIDIMNFSKTSGTLKSIINDLYKSIGKAVETVAGLMKTYNVDEDDKDAAKKKVIYSKLKAIHEGLEEIYEAMQNKLEPNKNKKVKAKSNENDDTEEDDEAE